MVYEIGLPPIGNPEPSSYTTLSCIIGCCTVEITPFPPFNCWKSITRHESLPFVNPTKGEGSLRVRVPWIFSIRWLRFCKHKEVGERRLEARNLWERKSETSAFFLPTVPQQFCVQQNLEF